MPFPTHQTLIIGLIAGATALSSTAWAQDDVDCSGDLELIPRNGAEITTTNLWLSYSGSIDDSNLGDTEQGQINGDTTTESMALRASSHVGLATTLDEPGDYEWQIAQGPTGQFTLADDATTDETPPTMGDGAVEAQLELTVYDEFPVMYREWSLSFPGATDGGTDAENMRYLVEFAWVDSEEGDEKSTILVTPEQASARDSMLTVGLGGQAKACRHDEPRVALAEEVELSVRAVDLAGNISENAATGNFKGASEEALATAHEDLQRVIEELRQASIAEREAEKARQEEAAKAAKQEEEAGCAAVSGAPSPLWLALLILGAIAAGRRRHSAMGATQS